MLAPALFISCVLALNDPASQNSSSRGDADSQQKARYALSAFQDARQKLHQGEYRISGHLDRTAEKDGIEGEIVIYSAFDFDADLFRFDRLEPCWIAKSSTPGGTASLTRGQIGGKFIRTPHKSIEWGSDGSKPASIKTATARPGAWIKPFDVRLAGWLEWEESDLSFPAGPTWSDFVEFSKKLAFESVTIEDETIYHLTFLDHSDPKIGITSKTDVWLDARFGYSPVRHEMRIRKSKETGDWPAEPYKKTSVNWTLISDAWVPTYVLQESGGRTPRRRELNFEWLSVNKEIEPKVFTLEGFDYPQTLPTYDVRHGRHVVMPSSRTSAAKTAKLAPAPAVNNVSRHWLILTYVAVLVAIVAYWGVSRRMRRRPPNVE